MQATSDKDERGRCTSRSGVRPQVGDGSPRWRGMKRSRREWKSGGKGPGEEDNHTLGTDTDRNSQRVIHDAVGNKSSKKLVISAGSDLISFLQASRTRWVSSTPRGYRLFLICNPDHVGPQIVSMTHRHHQEHSISFPWEISRPFFQNRSRRVCLSAKTFLFNSNEYIEVTKLSLSLLSGCILQCLLFDDFHETLFVFT